MPNVEKLPRKRRKDARPAEIIEAGLREFAERGYAGTRLDDVARRAGVAKGTIYRYFADKEALFMAAVRAHVQPVFMDMDAALGRSQLTSRELILFLINRLYLDLVNTDLRVLIRIVIAEGANFPALAQFYHRETISQGKALLEKIIVRGIERGEIRPGPAASLPMVLLGPAIMATIWKLTFDTIDPIETDDFLQAHIDLVLHGIWDGDGKSR